MRFPGKLGMCPSLAESDSGGIPRRELLLEKTVFRIRQKGVPPLLLPASVLQLPRCLVRTYNLDFHDATLFEWDSFKRCNCSRKNRLQSLICFANVGYSPTPRQHFWKIAGSKNFLVACGLGLETSLLGIPPESGSAESLCCLPLCCSPVVALSELVLHLSSITVYRNFLCF